MHSCNHHIGEWTHFVSIPGSENYPIPVYGVHYRPSPVVLVCGTGLAVQNLGFALVVCSESVV